MQEMTLEEYEKVMEEKRKTLEASKASERKVEVDKAFEKMQLVSNKKREEDIFIKLVGYLICVLVLLHAQCLSVCGLFSSIDAYRVFACMVIQGQEKEKSKREAAEREEKSRKVCNYL